MVLFVAIGLTIQEEAAVADLGVADRMLGLVAGSRMAVIAACSPWYCPAGARTWHMRRRGRVRARRWRLPRCWAFPAAAYAIPERGNQRSAATAAQVRWELARTSVRMTAANPAFGIGIGRFYSRSGEFSSPELLATFPPAVHENAHNNFLQILAELGIVGFGVLRWLLWSAAGYGRQLLGADLPILAVGSDDGTSGVRASRGWVGIRCSSTSPRSRFGSSSAPLPAGAPRSNRPSAPDCGRGPSRQR